MKSKTLLAAIIPLLLLVLAASDAPAQRRFPHQFTLDARALDTQYTPDPTSPRHRYRITAWGTYSMWEDTVNSSVDPVWIYSFPDEEWAKPEWRIFPEGYPIYVGDDRMFDSHGLRINNRPFPKLPFNATTHRYSTIIRGNGLPVGASIVDWNFLGLTKRDAHDNNSGRLYVLVEELPLSEMEICAIDSSAFPRIRVSMKVTRDSIRYEDFASKLVITENGTQVRIDTVNCAERAVPVGLAMVFDRSGSMDEAFGNSTRMTYTRAAGKKFIDRLQSQDEAAIYSFSLTTRIDQSWTNNTTLLKNAVDALQPDGWTAMNDAVIKAVDDISIRPSTRRKAIVLLSDGEDNRSVVRDIRTVIARARAAKVPVFAIGLLLDNDDSLRMLADSTGGRYFSISDPNAMDSVFLSVADLVLEKGCCSIYYTSPNPTRNRTVREVGASVTFENDTVLTEQTSYTAPGGTSSVTAIEERASGSRILGVYPNPIGRTARVKFVVGTAGYAVATLIDAQGSEAATLFEGQVEAGEREIEVTTEGIGAGQYFLRLSVKGETVIYPVVVAP